MLFDKLFAIYRVVSAKTSGAAKEIVAGVRSSQLDESASEPIFGAVGLVSRALPENEDGAAEYIGVKSGDEARMFAGRDERLTSKVNPKDGEVILVQYRGGFISLRDNADKNGTDITIYAVRNDADGNPEKASVISLDSSDAQNNIMIIHESGSSFVMTKAGEVACTSKDGNGFLLNDSGATFNCKISAPSIALGMGASVVPATIPTPGGPMSISGLYALVGPPV